MQPLDPMKLRLGGVLDLQRFGSDYVGGGHAACRQFFDAWRWLITKQKDGKRDDDKRPTPASIPA